MSALTAADHRAIVAEAARAPSVHNVQPTRWRFTDDGRVVLFLAPDRALPIADPSSHDVQASLGAAFEGTALALSTRGWSLAPPEPERAASASGLTAAVSARLVAGGTMDSLAPFVAARRSFRGRFLAAHPRDKEAVLLLASDDVRVITENATIAEIATLHDAATWSFESRPEYHAELWSWLRLSRRDPRYKRDGLTADCLALSTVERWAAARLLRPDRFAWLTRAGVARHLVSEASHVKSATALLCYTPRRADSAFDVGRRFYRLWLETAAAGFHLTPMSASADDARARDAIERRIALAGDRRLANVLRVGRAPAGKVAVSPRLPVDELLV